MQATTADLQACIAQPFRELNPNILGLVRTVSFLSQSFLFSSLFLFKEELLSHSSSATLNRRNMGMVN